MLTVPTVKVMGSLSGRGGGMSSQGWGKIGGSGPGSPLYDEDNDNDVHDSIRPSRLTASRSQNINERNWGSFTKRIKICLKLKTKLNHDDNNDRGTVRAAEKSYVV